MTITDPKVRTYFGVVTKDKITVARAAMAEYVLPVPLGSPRNYLGTGNLGKDTATFDPEYLWASVNGYCTGKEQGDQKASFYQLSPNCSGAAQRRLLGRQLLVHDRAPDAPGPTTPT